jgi:glyoxylase-like metal-dependent hydrolase (beta-lactamase superfamily II)
MIIETFVLSPFQQNTRVVACEKTKRAICIDPGEKSAALTNFLRENDLHLQAIALTHAHLDHIGGVSDFSAGFPRRKFFFTRRTKIYITVCPNSRFLWALRRIN